ncbi:hypothetical protein ACN9M1_16180 [Ralstonia sp. R-29]|uniref:hypothetical protein n=1 Tax=Ralstonia sp. R-29 TaxID=3404059 RepID=UPI003CF04714
MKHNHLTKLLCIAGLLLAAQTTHAAEDACTTQVESAIKRAYPSAKRTGDDYKINGARIQLSEAASPHAVVCRTWPAHPELTLMAVPLIQKEDEGTNEGDLELFVLDSSNATTIRQRLRLPGRMSDDAVRITSVSFDTARYQVAPGQTAFGLRITKEHNSRAIPFGETGLWLYTFDGNQLKPVLNGIVVDQYQGEWDSDCAGTSKQTHRTLATTSTARNSYVDITVSESIISTTGTLAKNGECGTQETKRRSTHRLMYDGKQYVVPKALAPLE